VRDRRAAAALYRKENLDRLRADDEAGKRFGRIQGEVTVELDGEELTAADVGALQYGRDRARRERSWRALAARRLEDRDAIDALLEELVALRDATARSADHPGYVSYRFQDLRRFDYTPADCDAFARGVEQHVVPLLLEMCERKRRALGLERLRPWDRFVDPWGAELGPLFETSEQFAQLGARVFERVDPELAGWFDILRRNDLLDLPARPGKAPGGYCIDLPSLRLPFLFLNAVGTPRDLEVLLHEGGHGFHTIACREREPADYRDCPSEFAEVASMSMELLGMDALPAVVGEERARGLGRSQVVSIVAGLCQTALIDTFQRWLYDEPGHSREARRARWLELHRRFLPDADWEGLEEERAHDWQRVPHFFTHPLYFIEYGVAQLGALQVWRNARRDAREGLRLYREALALGGSRPLPELFAAAGAELSFEPGLIGELMDELRPVVEELER
jgi:oligoendopeptidase F